MRKSSRGNPWHDEKGRFCSGPKAVSTSERNYETRQEAISRGEYDKDSARDLRQLTKRAIESPDGGSQNEWEIRRGGYDKWYEVYNNGEPAFGVIDGEVEVYQEKYRAYAEDFSAVSGYSLEERNGGNEFQEGTKETETGVQGRADSDRDDRGSRERTRDNRERYGRTSGGIGNVLHEERNPVRFKQALDEGRQTTPYGCYVDSHEPEELERMKMFLAEDGLAGVAVEEDGNICCAFKNSACGEKGMVNHLLSVAMENGGTKMDCFGRALTNMYESNGFKAVARIPYNGDYIDNNEFNRKLIENKPDVYVLMKLPEGETKHISSQAELDGLPTFDGENGYDEALQYRDSLMN